MLEHGEPGEVYNVGGGNERPNLEIVRDILASCGKPRDADRVRHRPARPRPPLRASSSAKVARARLGAARCASSEGLRDTVAWYRDNAWWWEPIRSGDYREYYERQYGRALG